MVASQAMAIGFAMMSPPRFPARMTITMTATTTQDLLRYYMMPSPRLYSLHASALSPTRNGKVRCIYNLLSHIDAVTFGAEYVWIYAQYFLCSVVVAVT